MTYIVNDNCIKCKLMDCMEVCTVDCFYEGDNMLVIKPDECIDRGVCEPQCPVHAMKSDIEKGASDSVEHNTQYSELWPNINKKRPEDVPQDQEKWRGVKGKLKYFSEKPGKGS